MNDTTLVNAQSTKGTTSRQESSSSRAPTAARSTSTPFSGPFHTIITLPIVSTAAGWGGVIGDAYKHQFLSSSAVAKSLDLFHGAMTLRTKLCVDASETTDELGDVGGLLLLLLEGDGRIFILPVAMEALGNGRIGARLGMGGWGIRTLDSFQPGMGPR